MLIQVLKKWEKILLNTFQNSCLKEEVEKLRFLSDGVVKVTKVLKLRTVFALIAY